MSCLWLITNQRSRLACSLVISYYDDNINMLAFQTKLFKIPICDLVSCPVYICIGLRTLYWNSDILKYIFDAYIPLVICSSERL